MTDAKVEIKKAILKHMAKWGSHYSDYTMGAAIHAHLNREGFATGHLREFVDAVSNVLTLYSPTVDEITEEVMQEAKIL